MKILRKSILAVLSVLVLATAAFASGGRLTLLSMNDIHGHIYPEDGAGGLAKAATVIEAIRGENPGNTLLFEIGDVNEGPLFFYFHGHAEMRGLSLLATDGVRLEFVAAGIRRLAEIAYQVNEKTENIGARRLYTVMEKLLEEVSFEAGRSSTVGTVVVDAAYVDSRLDMLAQREDLARYVL